MGEGQIQGDLPPAFLQRATPNTFPGWFPSFPNRLPYEASPYAALEWASLWQSPQEGQRWGTKVSQSHLCHVLKATRSLKLRGPGCLPVVTFCLPAYVSPCDSLPGSSLGHYRGQASNFPPPKAISVCCLLHTHLLCFARNAGRRDSNGSPSHIPVQLSLPHAYAYTFVVRADQVPGGGCGDTA